MKIAYIGLVDNLDKILNEIGKKNVIHVFEKSVNAVELINSSQKKDLVNSIAKLLENNVEILYNTKFIKSSSSRDDGICINCEDEIFYIGYDKVVLG